MITKEQLNYERQKALYDIYKIETKESYVAWREASAKEDAQKAKVELAEKILQSKQPLPILESALFDYALIKLGMTREQLFDDLVTGVDVEGCFKKEREIFYHAWGQKTKFTRQDGVNLYFVYDKIVMVEKE